MVLFPASVLLSYHYFCQFIYC